MLIKQEITKMPWGEKIVFLNKKLEKGGFIDTGLFKCEPGKSLQFHTHEGRDEFCWVFDGAGIFVIEGKEYEVKAGELIKIPKNLEHKSFPKGDSHFTSFFIVCP